MNFVHIPKTAGTSISMALNIRPIGHWIYNRDFDEFSWCVFRDPIDRFLSAFNYLRHNPKNEKDKKESRLYIRGQNIHEFLDDGFFDAVRGQQHFHPQVHWIPDGVDKIIPFNRLDEEFRKLYPRKLLPKVNKNEWVESDLTPQETDLILKVYYLDNLIYESLS